MQKCVRAALVLFYLLMLTILEIGCSQLRELHNIERERDQSFDNFCLTILTGPQCLVHPFHLLQMMMMMICSCCINTSHVSTIARSYPQAQNQNYKSRQKEKKLLINSQNNFNFQFNVLFKFCIIKRFLQVLTLERTVGLQS